MTYLRKLLFIVAASPIAAFAQVNPKLQAKLDQHAAEIQQKVIQWRRTFHQYPELSNQEVKTAAIIADHLRQLGLEVKTGIARTGVVAVLTQENPDRWLLFVPIWMHCLSRSAMS